MSVQATRIKTLRGDILTFLYNLNGTFAAERSIVQAYYEYYVTTDIAKALAYLTESKLIIKEERRHPVLEMRKESFYKIAPLGMNIIEGDKEDPGVSVVPDLKGAGT